MKTKTVCAVMKGMGVGIAVGAVTYLLTMQKRSKLSCIKKTCRKTLRNTGDLMNRLSYLIK